MFFLLSPLAPWHQGLFHRRGHRIILPGNEPGGGGASLLSSQWECSFQLAARWSRVLFSFFFLKGHNRVFLIRTGARPIDADARISKGRGEGKISGNIRKGTWRAEEISLSLFPSIERMYSPPPRGEYYLFVSVHLRVKIMLSMKIVNVNIECFVWTRWNVVNLIIGKNLRGSFQMQQADAR